MRPTIDADSSLSPSLLTQVSILVVLCHQIAGFIDMDATSGPGIETYTIYSGLDPTMVDVIGDNIFEGMLDGDPRDTMWTVVATLIDNVVLSETGDFTESPLTDAFTVSVTDYDPTCDDSTNAP